MARHHLQGSMTQIFTSCPVPGTLFPELGHRLHSLLNESVIPEEQFSLEMTPTFEVFELKWPQQASFFFFHMITLS